MRYKSKSNHRWTPSPAPTSPPRRPPPPITAQASKAEDALWEELAVLGPTAPLPPGMPEALYMSLPSHLRYGHVGSKLTFMPAFCCAWGVCVWCVWCGPI